MGFRILPRARGSTSELFSDKASARRGNLASPIQNTIGFFGGTAALGLFFQMP